MCVFSWGASISTMHCLLACRLSRGALGVNTARWGLFTVADGTVSLSDLHVGVRAVAPNKKTGPTEVVNTQQGAEIILSVSVMQGYSAWSWCLLALALNKLFIISSSWKFTKTAQGKGSLIINAFWHEVIESKGCDSYSLYCRQGSCLKPEYSRLLQVQC